MRIRVAALDCQQVARAGNPGRPEIDSVVTAVGTLAPAPHVLCLSGTLGLRLYSSAALLALTQRLNDLLPDGDFYYPFVSQRPGTRNPPGLWLSGRHIYPVANHELPHPNDPRPSHEVYPNTVEVVIAGVHVWLKALHWQHPDAPHGPIIQSAMDSQLANVPTVLLGALTHGSPDPGTAERGTDLDGLERVLRAGFWDAAQAVVELTPAAGTPAARILVSRNTPARLMAGGHVLTPATDSRTHAGVACDLNFLSQPTTSTDQP